MIHRSARKLRTGRLVLCVGIAAVSAVAAMVLSACGGMSGRVDSETEAVSMRLAAGLGEGRFKRAAEILPSGIEPIGVGAVKPGDAALLGVVMSTPAGEREMYIYLQVEGVGEEIQHVKGDATLNGVREELNIPTVGVTVSTYVYDDKLTMQSYSSSNAPAALLGKLHEAFEVISDLSDAAAANQGVRRTMTDEQRRSLIVGSASLVSFANTLSNAQSTGNGSFAKLLFEMVDRPSLIDLLVSGPTMSISMAGPARRVERPQDGSSCFIELAFAGRAALRANVTVGPYSRGTAVVCGVHSIDVISLQHPDRAMKIVLLSTKSGRRIGTPPIKAPA